MATTSVSVLRRSDWSSIPASPGVYWWYFPGAAIDQLRIAEFCDISQLRLRSTPNGNFCLYHGLAKNLTQRVKWHAAQRLTSSSLKTGFLSTFRLTLLALNGFDYLKGEEQIDKYFDGLSLGWQSVATREEAQFIERNELRGEYHYPLNIQENRRSEVLDYVAYLKSIRGAYKKRYVAE